MKRRHQEPKVVITLMGIPELRRADGRTLGSSITLTDLSASAAVREAAPAVAHAAELVSTPLLRNMGTLGGNLCLDTRCNYYNQNYEWRKAIDFCMKKDGAICWVAPSSPRCWAVSSSDVAPVMVALGGWDAVYHKLRRRGSFDFPVLGVAAWVRWEPGSGKRETRKVSEARVVLGGVASYPQEVPEAGIALKGTALEDESIKAAAEAAYRPAKPLDNTDFDLSWRKQMTRVYATRALEQLRQRAHGTLPT